MILRALPIIIIVIALFVQLKKCKIDWCSPCGVYCIFWGLFCLIAVLYPYKDYNLSYLGLYWIMLSCAVIFIISKFFARTRKNVLYNDCKIHNAVIGKIEIRFIKIILAIVIMLGLMKPMFDIYVNGFAIYDIFNFAKWAKISTVLTELRYSEQLQYSIVVQVLGVFMYLAPLLGGYIFSLTKRKSYLLSIFSIVPSVVNVFITSAKIALISAVINFFTGWVIGHIRRNGSAPRLTKKLLLRLILCSILSGLMLYIMMLWRIHDFSWATQKTIIDKFVVYAFGQMYAFDYWFANMFQIGHYGLGEHTFLAIFDMLGIAHRQQGVYDFVAVVYTNVFTAFRGLIQDFGLIGAILFLSATIGGGQYIYHKLKTGIVNSLEIGILSAVYFFILYSFVISPWTYISYILVFILFTVILKMSRSLQANKKTQRYISIKQVSRKNVGA